MLERDLVSFHEALTQRSTCQALAKSAPAPTPAPAPAPAPAGRLQGCAGGVGSSSAGTPSSGWFSFGVPSIRIGPGSRLFGVSPVEPVEPFSSRRWLWSEQCRENSNPARTALSGFLSSMPRCAIVSLSLSLLSALYTRLAMMLRARKMLACVHIVIMQSTCMLFASGVQAPFVTCACTSHRYAGSLPTHTLCTLTLRAACKFSLRTFVRCNMFLIQSAFDHLRLCLI